MSQLTAAVLAELCKGVHTHVWGGATVCLDIARSVCSCAFRKYAFIRKLLQPRTSLRLLAAAW
eukprot:4087336-Amphidinium_carterae.1